VDLLVNNAGVYLPGQIHDEPEKNLEFLLMVNLISAYHITRGVLETMIPRRSGHIFNIGSTASILAYPNGGSYCISKFAMYGMTKVLREELKELGIRVTAVLPGATFTQSWLGTDLPEERFMKPADIAETIWSAYNLSGNTVVEEVIMRPQLGDIL
jgi:short-subunit dehydrogenase